MVRSVVDAIGRGDFAAAGRLFDPGAEWHNTSSFPGPTICTGVDAIVEHWRTLFDDFELDGMTIEHLTDAGNCVVVQLHTAGRGRASGAPIDVRWASVYRLRGRRVVRVDVFGDHERALAAAGIAEGSGVGVVHAGLEAFVAGDLERVAGLYTPDAEITAVPDGWPEPAPVVGRDAVMRQFARLQEDWQQQSLEIERELVDRAWVLVELRWRTQGAGSGMSLDTTVSAAYRVEDGLIAEARFFWTWEEALEDLGLPVLDAGAGGA